MEKNNELPKGWIKKQIHELTESYSGGTPSTRNKEYWNGGKIPWIKSGEIKDNILIQSQSFISKKGLVNSSAKLYPPNTVLVAITGATTGKTSFLEIEACGTQNVFGILPGVYIFPKYMWYYMRFYYTILLSKVIGTAQKHVNGTILKNTPIVFPSLKEQQRIIEKIEDLFSLIDYVLENLTKIKKQIIQYRYSFYDTIFSSLETNPLESCCDLIAGQHIQKKDYNISKKGVPYLTGPADFTHKYAVVSKWTTSPKVIAKKGDVLITVKGAGVGKTNILNIKEASISRQLMAIRPHELSSHFVYSYFKSKFHEFQKMGQSSTVPGISKKLILNFPLPVVEPTEQKKITNQLESSQSIILNSTQIVEDIVKICSSLKSSILKQAFEGKLVPQDPNDEPASELLKRIKFQN